GGRFWPAIRRLFIWRYYVDYFPIKLHKTADLDPSKNYIIVCHPHGILPFGVFANFAFDVTGFRKKFPGITARLAALHLNFWMPIRREKLLFLGLCSAKKESIEYLLSKKGKGNAAVIVVGGAAEAFYAIPNTMHKNFDHSAPLVPCISFGENETFSQIYYDEKHWIKRIQNKLKNVFGVAFPIFYGRGIFGCKYGWIPYRKPINTIIGKPIDVERVENPKDEDVDKLHEVYVKELTDLFYAFREKYAENPKMEIVIK
ncbi:2-acylglycerol O-acyltransferase 2-like protein, partial [Dinothrombium tinctorium]